MPATFLGISTLFIARTILAPHANIRRVFFEVDRRPRTLARLKGRREELPWLRRLVDPVDSIPGEWRALPGDPQAAELLDRFGPLFQGTTGPAVVRLGATFSINPVTWRLKRGFFEPLMDSHEADMALGLKRALLRYWAAGHWLSSLATVWVAARLLVLSFMMGLLRMGSSHGAMQASAAAFASVVHVAWLLAVQPSASPAEGRRDLLAALLETASFLVFLDIASQPQSLAGCQALSRAMLLLQLAAFALYFVGLAVLLWSMLQTSLAVLHKRRGTAAMVTVLRDEDGVHLLVKRMANRWTNRALGELSTNPIRASFAFRGTNRCRCCAGRPLQGWPKLASPNYMERRLIEALLQSFPGNKHRDIETENSWDTMGIWLLRSCPTEDLLRKARGYARRPEPCPMLHLR